jgi:hypothetical protein
MDLDALEKIPRDMTGDRFGDLPTSRAVAKDKKSHRAVGSYWREACNTTNENEKMAMDRSYSEEQG